MDHEIRLFCQNPIACFSKSPYNSILTVHPFFYKVVRGTRGHGQLQVLFCINLYFIHVQLVRTIIMTCLICVLATHSHMFWINIRKDASLVSLCSKPKGDFPLCFKIQNEQKITKPWQNIFLWDQDQYTLIQDCIWVRTAPGGFISSGQLMMVRDLFLNFLWLFFLLFIVCIQCKQQQ